MADAADGEVAVREAVALARKARSDLGSGVRVVSSGPVVGLHDPVGRQDGVSRAGAEASMQDLVASRVASREGRVFAANFLPLGFMLANPETSPVRHAQQMAMARDPGTSVDDLQAVLRVTARRRGDLESKEPRMRVEAWERHNPDKAAIHYARHADQPRDVVFQGMVDKLGRMDHDEQRKLSELRDATGKVVVPAPRSLPEDSIAIKALGRGYQALAAELRVRGAVPEVMMKGASTTRGPAATPRRAALGRIDLDGVDP